MSRKRSSFTGNLILWVVLALIVWLIVTGQIHVGRLQP